MNKLIIIESKKVFTWFAFSVCIGITLGAAAGAFAMLPKSDEYHDQKRAMKTCALPDIDGSMSVFIMENGAIKCWRWK